MFVSSIICFFFFLKVTEKSPRKPVLNFFKPQTFQILITRTNKHSETTVNEKDFRSQNHVLIKCPDSVVQSTPNLGVYYPWRVVNFSTDIFLAPSSLGNSLIYCVPYFYNLGYAYWLEFVKIQLKKKRNQGTIRVDSHDTTLSHATSLRQANDMNCFV